MDVWVVFQNVNEDPFTPPILIEFQGVFDSRESALAACRTDRYVMGRCRLNDSAPHESSADFVARHIDTLRKLLERLHT